MAAFFAWLKKLLTPKVNKNEAPEAKLIRPMQDLLADQKTQQIPKWLSVARGEVGVKEAVGSADNPRIVEYHLSTSLDKGAAFQDETPWCSSFVNWCMEKAGEDGTNSAWARSWLRWGFSIDKPTYGCVVIFSRGTDSGHVAFFLKEVGPNLLVFGGNQNDSVCEALYPKERVLGYRWPKVKK